MGGDLVLAGFDAPFGDTLVCTDGLIDDIGWRLPRPTGHDVIDLGGASLLPGFVDAHAHLQMWGVQRRAVDLSAARSWTEALGLIRPDGGFFLGVGYDESSWPRPPAVRDLGSFDVPVVLRRICGHRAIANEAAVRAIGREHPWAVDGGDITERGALRLHDIFAPPMEARTGAAREAAAVFLRLGVTTVHEIAPDIRPLSLARTPLRWVAYRTLDGPDMPSTEGFAGVKLFADGSIGSRTAWLTEPYSDGGTGAPYMPPADMEEAVARAADRGLQVMVHALGDAAVSSVAGILARVADGHDLRRPRVEHLEIAPEAAWHALENVGAVGSMQPNFVVNWGMAGGMYETALGRRYLGMNRFRRAMRLGLAFGSDCMPPGPLFGIRGAMAHPDPGERLSPDEAIAAYTAGGARAGLEEGAVGRLAPGMRADAVAVRGRVPDGEVVLTVVGGEVVHSSIQMPRPSAAPAGPGPGTSVNRM